MKASKLISSCCGTLLDVPVFELVKKVETLETEKIFLENQLKNALDKIEVLSNGRN